MVRDHITDGRRIAQLLASEIRGRTDGPLGSLSVADVRDAEATPGGEFAYAVTRDGERVAEVFVHPDYALVTVHVDPEGALEAAESAGVRARPKGGEPARTLVFVERGADVKKVTDVFRSLQPAEDGG